MEAIIVKNVNKNYKNVKALDGVNLNVNEGELFGLLGVNGAGKTTLTNVLCGLTQKTSGKAYVLGYDLDENLNEIKKILDVSPQETSIALNLTVQENLEFFANVYGTNCKTYIDELLQIFKLDDVKNFKSKNLSGGYKRRLSVAIALISKPKILFLDEPTLGLDVIARRELWKIINKLKGKITIILTSHYLEEIEALCDRVAIMRKGKILEIGTSEELKQKTNSLTFEDAFVKLVEEAKYE